MADPAAFAKLVPGFDFLQGLMKNAGAGMPDMGQWIAPSLDPEELEKRIEQLRTVQFWLEQNARMLGATIQALEVQRMTLSTLQTMNVPLADLGRAMQLKTPAPTPEAPAPKAAAPTKTTRAAKAATAPAAGAVDPMQWWGALTRQFGELATRALQDSAAAAADAPAGASGAPAAEPVPKATPARRAARKRSR